MPFRPLANAYNACFTCATPAVESCRNCQQFYCQSHLKHGRCKACSGRLMEVSRREVVSAREDNYVLAMVFGVVGLLFTPILFMGSLPLVLLPVITLIAIGLSVALMKRASVGTICRRNKARQLSPRIQQGAKAVTISGLTGEDCDLCECRVLGSICRCEYGRDLCRRFGNPGGCDLMRPCHNAK